MSGCAPPPSRRGSSSASALRQLLSARAGEDSTPAVVARSPAGVFSQLRACQRYWVSKAAPTKLAWEWFGMARSWQTRGGLTSRLRAQVSRELRVCSLLLRPASSAILLNTSELGRGAYCPLEVSVTFINITKPIDRRVTGTWTWNFRAP